MKILIPESFAKTCLRNISTTELLKYVKDEPSLQETVNNYPYSKRSKRKDKNRIPKEQRQKKRSAARKEILAFLENHQEKLAEILKDNSALGTYTVYLVNEEEKRTFKKIESELQPLIDYAEKHTALLSEEVDALVQANKENIKTKFHKAIAEIYKNGIPEHLIYKPHSLFKFRTEGKIDTTQTVKHFLEEEYDGTELYHMPQTYGDSLQYDSLETGVHYLHEAIIKHLEKTFNTKLSEKQVNVFLMSFDTDPVYDNSIVSNFFLIEGLWEYLGEPDLTIEELLESMHYPICDRKK